MEGPRPENTTKELSEESHVHKEKRFPLDQLNPFSLSAPFQNGLSCGLSLLNGGGSFISFH